MSTTTAASANESDAIESNGKHNVLGVRSLIEIHSIDWRTAKGRKPNIQPRNVLRTDSVPRMCALQRMRHEDKCSDSAHIRAICIEYVGSFMICCLYLCRVTWNKKLFFQSFHCWSCYQFGVHRFHVVLLWFVCVCALFLFYGLTDNGLVLWCAVLLLLLRYVCVCVHAVVYGCMAVKISAREHSEFTWCCRKMWIDAIVYGAACICAFRSEFSRRPLHFLLHFQHASVLRQPPQYIQKTAARWPLSALLASMKTRHSTHRSKLEENARDSSSKCVRPSAEHVCIRIFHHSLCALYSNVSTYHHCTVKYDFHSVRMRYGSLLLFFSARAASWSAFAHCLRVCVCARCFSFNTYVCAVVYTLFLSSPVCELPFGGSSFNFLF